MSENKKYLGWGIIGTPKGRQAVGAGIDAQLELAKNFDLSQEFGACLPEAKQKDFTPLYFVSLQNKDQYKVLGVAEYRPINEQGQSRAGSYFGAFIESVNTQFAESNAEILLASLFELSSYQTTNFIDQNTVAYKESIYGKPVLEPSQILQIAENLQPLATNFLSQTAQGETLYIACNQGQAIETLQAILREQLYFRFKYIFFSESEHISAQMQKKPITKLQFAYLKGGQFFSEPYRNEVRYLHDVIKQQKSQMQRTEQALAEEKANFSRNVADRVLAEVQEKEKQYQQSIQDYQDQAKQAQQEAEKAKRSVESIQQAAKFGREIYDLVTANVPELSQYSGAETTVSNAQLQQSLASLQGDIKTLIMHSHSANTAQSQSEIEIRTVVKQSPIAWITTGLFAVLSLVFFSFWLFNDNDLSSKEVLPLEIRNEYGLELKDGKLQAKADSEKPNELKAQIEQLQKTATTAHPTPDEQIQNAIKEFNARLCEANPKDGKKIYIHKNDQAIYRDKLCQ